MAQLVQHLPRTQNIAGSSPARGSFSEELSSGVVACICLVSITDYTCTMYMLQVHNYNVLVYVHNILMYVMHVRT